MIERIKNHMKQPLTFGWYYKNMAIGAVLTAVFYGAICLIGYINSRKGYVDSWEGDEDEEE